MYADLNEHLKNAPSHLASFAAVFRLVPPHKREGRAQKRLQRRLPLTLTDKYQKNPHDSLLLKQKK